MHRAFGAMAGVAREIALGSEARELVCTAALTSLNATMATVIEPRETGFTITGSAGIPLDRSQIRRVEPVASLQAFHTRRRIFIPNAAQDSRVDQTIVRSTGLESIVYEPILRDGESVGVLAVGWDSHRVVVDAKTDAIMRFLAAEAGASIERADLLAQLDGLARSDPLTGLANRRTWNDAITSAMRDQTALCVAMIDLDHFKQYNDEYGHAAGDRLLKASAAAWRSHLRSDDVLARIGGEEFAVLLPRCSAHRRCRRPRATAPGHPQRGDGVDRRRGESARRRPERPPRPGRRSTLRSQERRAGPPPPRGRVERGFGREADRAAVRCPALDRRGGASAVRIVRGCPGRTASTGPPRWACATRRWPCTRSSSAPASSSRAGRRASRRCATACI